MEEPRGSKVESLKDALAVMRAHKVKESIMHASAYVAVRESMELTLKCWHMDIINSSIVDRSMGIARMSERGEIAKGLAAEEGPGLDRLLAPGHSQGLGHGQDRGLPVAATAAKITAESVVVVRT